MIPLVITEWIAPRLFKLAGAGIIAVAGVSACVVRDASIETRGAAKATARIEKANDNAANLGKRAAAKSGTPGVRGQRDPSTIND